MVLLLKLFFLKPPLNLSFVAHLSTFNLLELFTRVLGLAGRNTLSFFAISFNLLDQTIPLVFEQPRLDVLRRVLVDPIFFNVAQNFFLSLLFSFCSCNFGLIIL